MSIEVSGLDKVLKQLENIELDDALEGELLKECKVIFDEIVEQQPVDTGSQKRGWKGRIKRIDGKKTYVISNKNTFWVFEEYGTSFANHTNVGFIARAIENNIDEVADRMEKKIKELFG